MESDGEVLFPCDWFGDCGPCCASLESIGKSGDIIDARRYLKNTAGFTSWQDGQGFYEAWDTRTIEDYTWALSNHLLPFASVLVEPAKVLFLNNAINHGVLGPLGVAQSTETGKSVLFMIESNPGPGLGLLLAFLFFGPRSLRPSAPAAIDGIGPTDDWQGYWQRTDASKRKAANWANGH